MFHEGSPRFRAWSAAEAGARPELRDRFEEDARRLRQALAASERDREARLAAIHELQRDLAESARALAASERDRAARLAAIHELQGQLADCERNWAATVEAVQRLETELARRESQLAHLEAESIVREHDLAQRDAEAAAWIRVLPGVRLRVPGGRERADRLRRLRDRLLGRR